MSRDVLVTIVQVRISVDPSMVCISVDPSKWPVVLLVHAHRFLAIDVALQDTCMEMEVADPTGLPAAAKKLLQVVSAAPRMEAWIGQVCEAFYGGGGGETSGTKQGGDEEGGPSLSSIAMGLAPKGSVPDSVTKVQILLHTNIQSLSQYASLCHHDPTHPLASPPLFTQAASVCDPAAVHGLLSACRAALSEAASMRGVLVAIGGALQQRADPASRCAGRKGCGWREG